MSAEKIYQVALADDHILLRTALANLIDSFEDFKVIFQTGNGRELIDLIRPNNLPDILLLDLNMPEMDGYDTAHWFKDHYPQVHVLMLTMYDSEATLIRLLQAGVKGFLKKDVHPSELRNAMRSVVQNGYYYSHTTTGKLVNLFRHQNESEIQKNYLEDQEVSFLKLVASDMTYKEIALEIGLNPRAVDNIRDHLFEKLEVKSRVGLAIYAIRNGLVRL